MPREAVPNGRPSQLISKAEVIGPRVPSGLDWQTYLQWPPPATKKGQLRVPDNTLAGDCGTATLKCPNPALMSCGIRRLSHDPF